MTARQLPTVRRAFQYISHLQPQRLLRTYTTYIQQQNDYDSSRSLLLSKLQPGDISTNYQLIYHYNNKRPQNTLIEDTQLAQQFLDTIAINDSLVPLIGNWRECLDCLNLILNMTTDRPFTDKRFTKVGYVTKKADPQLLNNIIRVILSPQLAPALPDRHGAGITALQVFSDYEVSWKDNVESYVRAVGFASRKSVLERVIKDIEPEDLSSQNIIFEISMAYARCLDTAMSQEWLGKLKTMSEEQEIEAMATLAIAYAEYANERKAFEHLSLLRRLKCQDSQYMAMTELRVVYALLMSMVPRLPFTDNLHTMASRHRSHKYEGTDKLIEYIAQKLEGLADSEGKQYSVGSPFGRQLYLCQCLLFILYNFSGKHKYQPKEGVLIKLYPTLHKIQEEVFGNRRHERQPGMPELQHYLWAIATTPCISQRQKMTQIALELENAKKLLLGYSLSVEDIEPALVALLPSSVWEMSTKGNFRDDSAFMLSDDFMSMAPNSFEPMHPCKDRLLDWALEATHGRSGRSSDLRLMPLMVWLSILEGHTLQAVSMVKESIEAAQIRVRPGSLALANVRDRKYYTRMLEAVSQIQVRGRGDTVGRLVGVLWSMMKRQAWPIRNPGSRIVAELQYCCANTGNALMAGELLESAEQEESPKLLELYMRACFASGNNQRAVAIFHRLNYEISQHSQVGEPSFALIMRHLSEQVGMDSMSCVGVEHLFGVWIQVMSYSGKTSRSVAKMWEKTGCSRDARKTANAFEPKEPIGQVLEKLGVVRRKRAELSRLRFMRNWEYTMVTQLVGAYVRAGLVQRADLWDNWLLEALERRDLPMTPQRITATRHLQMRYLERGDWEGIEKAIQYVMAIDTRVLPLGLLFRDKYFKNQREVLQTIGVAISRDDELHDRMVELCKKKGKGFLVDKIYTVLSQMKF